MGIAGRLIGEIELRRMPWAVFAVAVLLALVGALFITSAASFSLARKHLIFTGMGICVFFCAALFDYRHLAGVSVVLYLVGLLSLALLFILGTTINYARRWYDLGWVHVQPSEPMKLILIIALADYFCMRKDVRKLSALGVPLVLTVVPMGFVALQPDLGTAMLFLPLFFAIAYLGGVPVRNLLLLVAAGLVLFTCAWFLPGALRPYQKSRIISFIDPQRDPHSSASYNAQQATLAIGSGGLWGKGWGQGHLNRLEWLPERHTDFIFPVIAEEWGFIRTCGVICLYLVLITLLGRVAFRAREPFGRLIAGGVLVLFSVQSLLHVAISLRLAPVTGLTLPLVSYGGSSLLTTFAGLGLVASVAIRKSFLFTEGD